MRRTLNVIFVVLVVAGLFLAWTNPAIDDFQSFAVERLEEEAVEELGDTRIGRLLGDAGARLAGIYIEQVTRRQSYIVYSTFTIPLTPREEDEWVFLGIGGQFFEIQRPEVLRNRTARLDEQE